MNTETWELIDKIEISSWVMLLIETGAGAVCLTHSEEDFRNYTVLNVDKARRLIAALQRAVERVEESEDE